MLYHNIKNSNEEKNQEKRRTRKKIITAILSTKKYNRIVETLEINRQSNRQEKSTKKKEVKRMIEETAGRTKCQTIQNDKWGIKGIHIADKLFECVFDYKGKQQ